MNYKIFDKEYILLYSNELEVTLTNRQQKNKARKQCKHGNVSSEPSICNYT